MKKRYSKTIFRKILLPVMHGSTCEASLAAACALAGGGQVILVGMVCVPAGETLSAAAAPAREVRETLRGLLVDERFRMAERVHAAYDPWSELVSVVQSEKPDLLLIEWPSDFERLQIPQDAFRHPPCDVAIVGGPIPKQPQNLVVPIRGGPYAELALRLSLALARNNQASVTSLHLSAPDSHARQDAPFRGLERVLLQLPEIKREAIATSDPESTLLATARRFDLMVMGATARPDNLPFPIGRVAETLFREAACGVMVVKTRQPAPVSYESETVGQSAISVLVDKWFAENTYSADEFADFDALLALKQKQNVTISLALPALNEEETVGKVIQTVKTALMEKVPLLDEIVLIDSNSQDRTREIAAGLGVPVYIHQETLPNYGARRGKGEALWKSIYLTRGDIILWIDTDIVNIQPHFVYGLIGPLLLRPEVQLVKGFYQRPLKVGDKLQAGSGGRVTELTARPMLNLFYPELSGLIQPLSGEYGGRRTALERLPFSSGYGVEISLLIDMLESFGLSAITQVDLKERIHHNQPLEALSKMSYVILQAVFRKLERRYGHALLDEVNRSMKLIRYEPGRFSLDVEEIPEQERPPMLEIPEYRER
jgi:glucosyl-3-phosphoglycerate synthase